MPTASAWRRARQFLLLLGLCLVVLLAGCDDDADIALSDVAPGDTPTTDEPADPPPGTPMAPLVAGGDADEAVTARDYDATVVNPNDGTEIKITVLQPKLEPGEIAPLVLQSHGFGGTRLRGRDQPSLYETLTGGTLPSAEAARRAAKAGYFVISFDERGFGESGGKVEVMDPRFEGEDIKAILDWAEQQMDHRGHLGYRDGNLAVGALGLSYGGGFQLIGAGVDPRFDALVPTAAWYDLTYSLSPDDVIKSTWGVLLVTAGIPTSRLRLDPFLYRALIEGLAAPLGGDGFSNNVADRLYNNSPASFCNANVSENGEKVPDPTGQRTTPQVDALLIQGVADTLFSYNEGVANAQCLRAAGNDVQLIGMRYGHTLPLVQNLDRVLYKTETTLHCGETTYETAALELDYLNWKLRGDAPDKPIPANCMIIDDDTGLVFDEPPVGPGMAGATASFEGETTTGGLSLLRSLLDSHPVEQLVETVKGTVDNARELVELLVNPDVQPPEDTNAAFVLAKLINVLPADQIDTLTSGGTFVPLQTIDRAGLALAGIPTAEVTVTGNAANPIVFMGIGVKPAGADTAVLVDKQIRPVRGTGERDIELNGVSRRLHAGDTVGVMLYGFHPQYAASFSLIPGTVRVAGDIGLPIAVIPDS